MSIYDTLTSLAVQDAEQTISPEVQKRAIAKYEYRLRGSEPEPAWERALIGEPTVGPEIAINRDAPTQQPARTYRPR